MNVNTGFDQVVVFGEVLFDIFPDRSMVIGGAPFNVACHLRGLGLDPLFISRVGNDRLGREVIQHMHSWSMSTKGIQVDKIKSTGIVQVRFDQGEPFYEIQKDVAYDYLHPPDPKECGMLSKRLFYHGTLAARSDISAETLYSMASWKDQQVFCDINLRDPWWNHKLVLDVVSWCSYLKVNLAELDQVAGILGIRHVEIEKKARAIQEKGGLEGLVLTMGDQGAMLFPRETESLYSSASQVDSYQDAVGAGDAFRAVFLLGICRRWSWKKILERALAVAARVCTIQGAIPHDPGFYKSLTRKWEV